MKPLALVAVVAVAALAGCLRPCDDYVRSAIWTQDDVPAPEGYIVDYRLGNLWGGASRHPETGEIHLEVFAKQDVSHEELVRFADSLFQAKGWPQPRLEGAREEAGCGDHY
ncbi:MAG: hypothetical protein ACYC2H_12070 [Thermoplasmatota archaeon]